MMHRKMFMMAIFIGATLAGLPSSHAKGVCTMIWLPVCATKDGVEKTYTNKGCAKVDGAEVVRVGRCEDPRPSQTTYCTMEYIPVCAAKNGAETTYSNACVALADGATVKYKGKCGTDR